MYDVKLDQLFGPHDYAQKIFIRSVYGSWKFPIFVDYDVPVSKHVYLETIYHLESISVKVLITTCDQGTKNQGLATELGVSISNVIVPNPYDASRVVFFSFDFIHIFKTHF